MELDKPKLINRGDVRVGDIILYKLLLANGKTINPILRIKAFNINRNYRKFECIILLSDFSDSAEVGDIINYGLDSGEIYLLQQGDGEICIK